jgi:putative DNA methylase
MAGRLGTQLMAVAVDGPVGRRYLDPSAVPALPEVGRPTDAPATELPNYARWFSSPAYGMGHWADIYTNRQLVALGAFADAVRRVPEWVTADGGNESQAKAISSVLGLCVSKLAMSNSTQARWYIGNDSGSTRIIPAFSRHALPMSWDFPELNPFGERSANWLGMLESVGSGIRALPTDVRGGTVFQSDARTSVSHVEGSLLIATDPPYFAQIGYADLSDYFYFWLRRALGNVHPELFHTVVTPKADELIAAPYRHQGSLKEATSFFVEGYTATFKTLKDSSAPSPPLLVVYAHKQEETGGEEGLTSTGWDAMLSAILSAGLRIVGTWPIRSAHSSKQIGIGTNALASYMVLVCRPQLVGAKATDRQRFLASLHAELPKAIRKVQQGDISTIDLGPAAIGPGMEVFSRYSRVIEPSGKPMTVGGALALISEVTGEVLDEFVGDLDGETRWGMGWFRDHGFGGGTFDDAEKLFRTTVTSMDGVERAGIAAGSRGQVRLLPRAELPETWSPRSDRRVTVWEVTQHLAKRLDEGSEAAAGELLAECGRWADAARDLAQWLAKTAMDTGRPGEALAFDALVTSWSELQRRADRVAASSPAAGRFAGMAD